MKLLQSQTLLMLTILIFSSLYAPYFSGAAVGQLPQLGESDLPPEIDGNITSSEWQNSLLFNITLVGEDAAIRVTTNQTHMFIGFNYTTTDFSPVNNTVPAFNNTIANYTLGYNNQTHDWFAFVFDNNLDMAFDEVSNVIGTSSSPDDVVVVDQYNGSYYDGYAAGESEVLFRPDSSILYNGTVDPEDTAGINNETISLGINGTLLEGNEGSSDVFLGSMNTTDGETTTLSYELIKPLSSGDNLGYDFNIETTRMLQFKLLYFDNAQANSSMTSGVTTFDHTEWFSLRVNETGNGVALKSAEEASVNLLVSDENSDAYDGMRTILSSYGFEVNSISSITENSTLESFDLNILVLDAATELTTDNLDDLESYLSLGGQALVLLSGESSVLSRNLANRLGVTFLPNSVLLPDTVNESISSIEIDAFKTELPFSTQMSPYTSYDVNSLNFTTSALNISTLLDASRKYVFSQEYMVYDLFELPANLIYDRDDNGLADDDESTAGLSLGFALDLLKGGRITVLPSNALFDDTQLTLNDNIPFLLRLLPWTSRLIDTIEVHEVNVDRHAIELNDEITVSANVTDGFGNELSEDPTILIELNIAGTIPKEVTLEKSSGSMYTATFDINDQGYYELEITAMLENYGFAEGDTISVFVENKIGSFNDLSQLDPFLIALFLLSVIAVGIIYTRTRST